jgi:hypothetical protein
VREYWRRALDADPDLTFTLDGAYPGVSSVVLCYRDAGEIAGAEFMRFDSTGRVREVIAHHAPQRSAAAVDQADGAR